MAQQVLCSECGSTFMDKRSLIKHLVIHDKREFSCGDCGKLCVGNKAFKNHMVSHQVFKCETCKKDVLGEVLKKLLTVIFALI